MTPQNIDSLLIYLRNTKYYLIFVSAVNRYITIREVFLEKILQKNNIITKLIIYYFRFIIFFRYYCEVVSTKIQSHWLCTIFLFLSLYLSAVHLAWLGWVIMFLIWRLEFSFSVIHHFYKSRTSLIPQHFPDSQDPKRRMHKAAKVIAEAMQQNKIAVTVATGAAGFTAWKYMDYKTAVETRETTRETTKAEIEADAIQQQKNRDAEDLRAQKNREAEDLRFNRQMQLEDRRHRENLEAEAVQRQKDRDDEYRRHRENLEAEDRRHRETLEIENQKNRENRLSDINYNSTNQNITSEVTESSLTVD